MEVKSGKTGTLRSLHQFINRSNHPYAVRLYAGPLAKTTTETPEGKPYTLLSLPSFWLKKHQYRKYYYATNRSYYKQGGITYEAVISIVGAERYSVLGKELFSEKHGILIAYDPMVILGIFESMGISKALINRLSIEDLIEIRESSIFAVFREAYYSFALTLQELAMSTNRISKSFIFNSKSEFTKEFISRYFTEEVLFRKYTSNWNIGEMTFFALALGTVGFFVIPVLGAVLGVVPILLYKLDLTPKLSNVVIEKITEKETPFFLFINELRDISKNMKKIESSETFKTQQRH